jgi:phosphatidylglycerophosphatase A
MHVSSTAAPKQKRTRTAWMWAAFFGAGYLKPGPGTYGSVAAALVWLTAAHLFHPDRAELVLSTTVCAVFVTLTGIPASTRVARESGRKDPGFVVIDEVAGQLFALLPLTGTWQHALLGLVLFRILDIFKPWPIRRLEAVPEGTGIMLDDVAAGLIAAALSTFLLYFVPSWR